MYDSFPDSTIPEWVNEEVIKKEIFFKEEFDIKLKHLIDRKITMYGQDEIKELIIEILSQNDPRSKVKIKNNQNNYGFLIDTLNILCTFNENTIFVYDVEYWSDYKKLNF
jgi:hypothetical protein